MQTSCLAVKAKPAPAALMIPGIGISYLKSIQVLRHNPLFQNNCAKAGISDCRDADAAFFEDRGPALHDNLVNQKVSYVVNCTMSDLLKERGIMIDLIVGYSMGLYAALYAGGYYSFDDGLRVVEKAFYLARESFLSKSQRYGMGIILGLSEKNIRTLVFEQEEKQVEIAVYNGKRSFVIAGEKERVRSCLKKASHVGALGARMILTEHPYHTSFLRGISEEFSKFLKTVTFRSPYCDVISSIDGKIIARSDAPDVIVKAMYTPLHFDLAITEALARYNISACYETGPAKSMDKLVRYINRKMRVSPFEEIPC